MIPKILVPGVSLCVAVAASAASPRAGGWEPLPPLPQGNGGATCGVAGGKIVVVGGANWVDGKKIWLRDVSEFDPASRAWRVRDQLPEPSAWGLGAEMPGGFLVIGGTTGRELTQAVARVTAKGTTRTPADWLEAVMYIMGGRMGDEVVGVGGTRDVSKVSGSTARVWAWNPESGRARELPAYPGGPISLAASVIVGDELFVFGGAAPDPATHEDRNVRGAFAYSHGRSAWRHLKDYPNATRIASAVRIGERWIYIGGGYDETGFTDAGYLYDIEGDRYEASRPIPIAACVALVRCGDWIYCLGGEDRPAHRTDTAFRIAVADLQPGERDR